MRLSRSSRRCISNGTCAPGRKWRITLVNHLGGWGLWKVVGGLDRWRSLWSLIHNTLAWQFLLGKFEFIDLQECLGEGLSSVTWPLRPLDNISMLRHKLLLLPGDQRTFYMQSSLEEPIFPEVGWHADLAEAAQAAIQNAQAKVGIPLR